VRIARVERPADLVSVMRELELYGPRPTLVVVGGADDMDDADRASAEPIFAALAGLAARIGVAVVDGGTDAGVMQLMGHARGHSGLFPLVGVAVETLVTEPGAEPEGEQAALEPNHSHVVLVPGTRWGDEVPWIGRVADLLAGGAPSATVVFNGGDVAFADVGESVAAGREVLVLAGSGRAADTIAAALSGSPADERSRSLVFSGLVHAVDLRDDGCAMLVRRLETIFAPRR
jgi:SLOG in TRPM, prokaryote